MRVFGAYSSGGEMLGLWGVWRSTMREVRDDEGHRSFALTFRSGCRVSGVSGVKSWGSRVQGLGFRVKGLGLRI